jgi:hypothetical protein
VKYDGSGNVVWAKGAGAASVDRATGIAVDGSGNSYVTGYFYGINITFGSFILNNAKPGYSDVFVVKYDSSGNVVWAKRGYGTYNEESTSIAVDDNGNSYVTGWFTSSSITFGSFTLTNTSTGGL